MEITNKVVKNALMAKERAAMNEVAGEKIVSGAIDQLKSLVTEVRRSRGKVTPQIAKDWNKAMFQIEDLIKGKMASRPEELNQIVKDMNHITKGAPAILGPIGFPKIQDYMIS